MAESRRAYYLLGAALIMVVAIMVALSVVGGRAAHAVPTTFKVTNTNDSGAGSLYQAILDANANLGADTINFKIPGSGVKTISPDSELPNITEAVTINGYSQRPCSTNPPPCSKLNTLAVGNNAKLLIELSGAEAPGGSGLRIGAPNSVVRGLIINGWDNGVRLGGNDATANKVVGNFIGTNASGTQALGNSNGVTMVDAPTNFVGGTTAGARNIISGSSNGVNIQGVGATGNKVMGNYIGTDASGTQGLGVSGDGVRISTPNNIVGGTTLGARNVISALDEGVVIVGNGARGNKVIGNYIGTDRSGTNDLGNDTSGVSIVNAPNNFVGDTIAGARNIIAFNGEAGVGIFGEGATGNRVLSNSIFATLGQGIALGIDGPTPNDAGDGDTGPNNLQNFPVITSATTTGTQITIKGTLNSTPNRTFLIQFFSNLASEPAGNEGRRFLGQKSVTTGANGNVSFTRGLALAVPAGQKVTATATGPGGNTSEFSAARLVVRQ